MYNCHEDMLAYHNEKVTLPGADQAEMRERRDANRNKVKAGLKREGEPSPLEFRSQGSYAMRTMVQHPEKDYDIDDGIYFAKEDLKGPRGADRTPADVKEMVHKALHDDKFNTPPEVRTNCVRVYYDSGYHVDVPVYRRFERKNLLGEMETVDEIASTEWKRSDPIAVTDWFKDENERQSPDMDNGGQLRRDVRLLKAFGRSRESWRSRIATGFMVTKLVVERYQPDQDREDRALYNTMVAIRDRLNGNLEIDHPTMAGEKITKGPKDGRPKFLKERLDWAIDELKVLFELDCTRAKALKAWDSVFNTDFFSSRLHKTDAVTATHQREGMSGGAALALGLGAAAVAAAFISKRGVAVEPTQPVDKRGGGRYG